jgi:hypothetical protein
MRRLLIAAIFSLFVVAIAVTAMLVLMHRSPYPGATYEFAERAAHAIGACH